MLKKLTLSLIIFIFASALSEAVENPNVGSPFNTRNAPTHSGQQQRFITRGNPYGKIGNDIVTGNVGGGKHFRGVIPYGSSYYYRGLNRSGSVNNFIRRSTDPLVNDRNPGQIHTYYDPQRSVSSMRRPDGISGLSNPQLTGQGRTNPYIIPTAVRTITPPTYQRPLSTNNMDLEQILSRREQLKEQSKQAEKDSADDKKGFFDEPLIPDQTQENTEETDEESSAPVSALDRILAEEEAMSQQAFDSASDETDESADRNPVQMKDRISPESDLVPKLDMEGLTEKGRKVLGKHKTFASLANEKFTGFMDAAETFIKDGQFYKAADAYALAVIWKPEDARGYLGQSFSLFAAGEYMSSAYYLNRAFELNPKAATKKYNIEEFLENRDVLENRILEITTWQEKSGSGELSFLLAYISYQDGKTDRAVSEIRRAKEIMPDASAVTLLKNVIDPEQASN